MSTMFQRLVVSAAVALAGANLPAIAQEAEGAQSSDSPITLTVSLSGERALGADFNAPNELTFSREIGDSCVGTIAFDAENLDGSAFRFDQSQWNVALATLACTQGNTTVTIGKKDFDGANGWLKPFPANGFVITSDEFSIINHVIYDPVGVWVDHDFDAFGNWDGHAKLGAFRVIPDFNESTGPGQALRGGLGDTNEVSGLANFSLSRTFDGGTFVEVGAEAAKYAAGDAVEADYSHVSIYGQFNGSLSENWSYHSSFDKVWAQNLGGQAGYDADSLMVTADIVRDNLFGIPELSTYGLVGYNEVPGATPLETDYTAQSIETGVNYRFTDALKREFGIETAWDCAATGRIDYTTFSAGSPFGNDQVGKLVGVQCTRTLG